MISIHSKHLSHLYQSSPTHTHVYIYIYIYIYIFIYTGWIYVCRVSPFAGVHAAKDAEESKQ